MYMQNFRGVDFYIGLLLALWRKYCHLLKCILWFSHILAVNSELIICTPGESGLINIESIIFTKATHLVSTS